MIWMGARVTQVDTQETSDTDTDTDTDTDIDTDQDVRVRIEWGPRRDYTQSVCV